MPTSPRLVVGWFLRTRWPTDRWSLSAGITPRGPYHFGKFSLTKSESSFYHFGNFYLTKYRYIISDPSFAMEHSDELIFYDEELDLYLLAVTHFGTAWDCVPAPELH